MMRIFKGTQTGAGAKGKGTGKYESFSTPFMEVGKGNLSLPQVNRNLLGAGGSIRFGTENLFPQLLNQMYYTSPLNSAIIDFKTNSVCGGGFEIEPRKKDAKTKTDVYAFLKRNKLNKSTKQVTRELIAHERVYFTLTFRQIKKEGRVVGMRPLKMRFCGSDKVRVTRDSSVYLTSDDWSVSTGIRKIRAYHPQCTDEEQLYVYENDSLGQDYYPIPAYSTALNWCFLDGESSYLHKTNIKESIFPSFAMFFPKKPANKEEVESVKSTIEGVKGAQAAGRIFTFFANNKDQLPTMEAIPKNNNDQLFIQTDERMDSKICQAHVIDPILMGIRVSGKLGSGSDIKQSYTIYEKNFVKMKRDEVEEIYNDLLEIFNVEATYKINDFQIINETIVEIEGGSETLDALNKVSPLIGTKVLESMTVNQKLSLVGLPPIAGGNIAPSSEVQQKIKNEAA